MATVICVTCHRDWSDLFRQAVSFEKYLPPDFKIVYIVEDKDPTEWLKCWNNCHLKNLPNVTVLLGNQIVSSNINGWVRQQLLKLLVTSREHGLCWIVDSKDFLIRHPTSELGNTFAVACNESQVHTRVINLYKSVLNIENANLLILPHTPFEFNPVHVNHLINGFGGELLFTQWFTSMQHHSEFILYQLWCQQHNLDINIGKRTQIVQKLWAPTGPVFGDSILQGSKDIISLLDFSYPTWVSKHRWASIFWDTDTIKNWNLFLCNHSLPTLPGEFFKNHNQVLLLEFCRHKIAIA
jgi:hypothetical protein